MAVDDRSLHRAMRRLKQLELVDETQRPGERTGADRKYYELTATGKNILNAFLQRHIRQVYLNGNTELFTRDANTG